MSGIRPFADPALEDLEQIKDMRDLSYLVQPVHDTIVKVAEERGINLEKYTFLDISLDGYNEEVSEYSCGFALNVCDPEFQIAELEFFVTLRDDAIVKTSVKLESIELDV